MHQAKRSIITYFSKIFWTDGKSFLRFSITRAVPSAYARGVHAVMRVAKQPSKEPTTVTKISGERGHPWRMPRPISQQSDTAL